jgi:uncharacterized protein RhaS with RHS repeats
VSTTSGSLKTPRFLTLPDPIQRRRAHLYLHHRWGEQPPCFYAAGGAAVNYAYDANGSVGSDGVNSYGYNAAGRLQSASGAVYTYNGLDQRVKKVAPDGTKLFVYDEAGELIGEYDQAGTRIEETTYLGNIPLTVSTPAATYWIHTDHLNAPREIFNAASKLVWQWDFATFGSNLPNENPSGLGVFSYNVRFPGQYFDKETGLFYNYHRDLHR